MYKAVCGSSLVSSVKYESMINATSYGFCEFGEQKAVKFVIFLNCQVPTVHITDLNFFTVVDAALTYVSKRSLGQTMDLEIVENSNSCGKLQLFT